MMTQEEFNQWCVKQSLSNQAIIEIEKIRNAQPSRRVGSRCKNVSGRYPSRKMGVTIQFESHQVELPFIYQLEHAEDVLEYYDQPPPFKIQYTSASGRNLGVIITPDFFVIRSHSAAWVECKTESELEKLAQKSPHRYQISNNNKWQSPPGFYYAQQFGFDFQLWSNAKINWTLQRNLEFLEDYYKNDLSLKHDDNYNIVMSLVEAQPGISIAKLLDYKGVNVDHIYSLIATEKIYVDLTAYLLVEADKSQVFQSRVIENALKAIICTENSDQMITPIVNIIPGTSVFYDGVCLNIILVGQDYLLLSAKEFETIELKLSDFFVLVNTGKIQINPLKNQSLIYEQAMEILKQASTEDLINANRRFSLLKPYLDEQSITTARPKERTLRRWLHSYYQAQEKYGYGYLGLISLNHRKGNHNRKLPQHIIEILSKFITEEYENKKQKTKQAVYASFVHSCSKAGIGDDQIPSYKTFINEIKKYPKHSQVEKRSGDRAAYEMEAFYWELEQALKQRRPKIFFIDEAHHLLAVASGRKLTDVPEAIKSLASLTQVLHGLIGTYDLLTLHDIGDQLSRRSIYVHLPRYNAEFIEDREIWHSVIWNFQCQIPTKEPPDFLSHWEYLYSRSLGCVGILKNWSRNALGEALNEDAPTVTLKHLEKRALSVGQCRNILKHIKQGEARYAEIEGKIEELYQDLGLRCPPISKHQITSQSEIKSQDIEPKKRKKLVGIRKPRRDSIGSENAV